VALGQAYPVFDNHFHLDPDGRKAEAVKDFVRSGGTHLMLVHKPYRELASTPDKQREALETTLRLAEIARSVEGVTVFVALCPHPAELTEMMKIGMSLEESRIVMEAGIRRAAELIREGKAVAMGEAGRPHYPVSEDVWRVSNELMRLELELCRDLGVAPILHTESATPEVFANLARIGKEVGFPVERMVKHYSPAIVDEKLNHGLFPSVIVGKGQAEEAARQGTRFMMETDYTDEPRMEDGEILPGTATGAVLGPKTVPRRSNELVEKGIIAAEALWKIHKENPEKVYRISIEL
jgi:TatD-related deoxyribonuclease